MSNKFHLAINGGDLSVNVSFYQTALKCPLGADAEVGHYQDIDFWGNELTLHQSMPRQELDCSWHEVDMGKVPVPHLGIHLSRVEWENTVSNVTELYPDHILLKPFIRYEGTDTEQRTFFIRDANYNVIEIKYLKVNE